MAERKTKAPAKKPEVVHSVGEREYFDHVRKINDTFYDQIRIADQKAAYIFTFMLAFLVSSAEGRSVFRLDRYQSGEVLRMLLSGLMAAAVVTTLVCAILVVLPRVRTTATSLFWGVWDIERKKLLDAREALDADYLFREYLDNATNLSLIARQKYQFVRFAFRGLLIAVMSYVALLVTAA